MKNTNSLRVGIGRWLYLKNIYIIGVPRSGKTTLAKLIKEKFNNVNQVSFEAIRNGFIKTMPELDMGNRNSEARLNILPEFIVEFVKWNSEITKCSTLIEGSFISVSKLMSLVDKEDIVICLGHGRKSLNEIIDNVIKYDTNNDYTKEWSKERLEKHFYDIEKKDEDNFSDCLKYGINYYDTTKRNNSLNEIIAYLESVL